MSFRRRLALACAAAVAVAVVLAAALAYVARARQLRGQIDASLRSRRATVGAAAPSGEPAARPAPRRRSGAGSRSTAPVAFIQASTPGGAPARAAGEQPARSVDREERRRRSPTGDARAVLRRRDGRRHARARASPRAAARRRRAAGRAPADEVDATLGTAAARRSAAIVARRHRAAALRSRGSPRARAVSPVAELTDDGRARRRARATSRAGSSASGDDELARLAARFNTMLEALDDSQRAQRRLVADASHELRTPLTSLRTNLEVLGRAAGSPAADRERLRGDLVAPARGADRARRRPRRARARRRAGRRAVEALRLDELVGGRGRARRAATRRRVTFETELEPCWSRACAARLDRAVANLLDNAAKWSPPARRRGARCATAS